MPSTVLNWLTATRRPRDSGGAISAMYMGETTEATPIAMPPVNRKISSDAQFQARPQPSEVTK